MLSSRSIALGVLLPLLAFSQVAWSASTLKAGFAERDITPDIGMEQPGNYMKQFHRVKHDACKVRASVFDDGNGRVAIVGIDALKIRHATVAAARKIIHDKTGIDESAILVAASHTHSGGPTGMVLPGEYDDAPELVRKLAYDQSSCADGKYLERIITAMADAVVEADGKRVEVKAASGFGIEDKAAFNRRFLMKNGMTFTHPGVGNPDIIEPAGPTDPQVGVLGAWTKEGKLAGCIVNFACHATTGPGGTSADYIYYVEKTIRGLFGEEVIVVFLAGMAADVTQVDNRITSAVKQSGEGASRFVGGRIGAEAVKTLLLLERSAGTETPVLSRTQILKSRRRPPALDRVERALKMVANPPGKGVDQTDWIFAKETVMLDYLVKKTPVVDVELQAIQIGPAVLLACPAEYFDAYGLILKQQSGFPVTFPVSLANDCVGYVPMPAAFGPAGGGYETRLTSYSNLDVGTGDKICEGLLAIAKTLKPGALPQITPAPPFSGKPWAYGNRPAESE